MEIWVGSLCKGAPKCAIRIRSSFPWLVIGSFWWEGLIMLTSWAKWSGFRTKE
ncbi:hypothetical protein GBA52_002685 [Prunus armeniaca]|nr:hypothetical protein GBA52_002685 [Prunus armeniaca]